MKVKDYIKDLESIIEELVDKDPDMEIEYLTHCEPEYKVNDFTKEKPLSDEVMAELTRQSNDLKKLSDKVLTLLENAGFEITHIRNEKTQTSFNAIYNFPDTSTIKNKKFKYFFEIKNMVSVYIVTGPKTQDYLNGFWYDAIDKIIPRLKEDMVWTLRR
jgi:hypothetical protein